MTLRRRIGSWFVGFILLLLMVMTTNGDYDGDFGLLKVHV